VAYASVAVLKAAGVPVSGGVGGRDEQFALPGVPPGTYAVRVSFLGYQDFVRPSVVVPAGPPWPWGPCHWWPRPKSWAKWW